MRQTFYSVQGVGVFSEWSECEEALKGLPNPVFKSFRTLPAAEAFLQGWDQSSPSSESPFGFAGPSTLPPTPTNKLGRGGLPFVQKVIKKKVSASAVEPPSNSSIPSRPRASPSQSLAPSGGGGSLSPSGSPDPSASYRRRSPLIQIVVEEEDEPPAEDLTPPSSAADDSESIPSRSRSGSTSASSSGHLPSLGKKRKSIMGLGLGNVLSLSPAGPNTPPASPEMRARRSLSPSSTDTGSASSSHQSEVSAPASLKSRIVARRQSWLGMGGTTTASTSTPSTSASFSATNTLTIPSSSPQAPTLNHSQSARSMWSDSTLTPPSSLAPRPPAASMAPPPLSFPPPASSASSSDPYASFSSSTTPVFTRQGSSSSIVLPLRSPASSSTSLHRQKSLLSLRHVPSNSSLRSVGSTSLEPPKLGRFGASYSNNSSAAGSLESLSEIGGLGAMPVKSSMVGGGGSNSRRGSVLSVATLAVPTNEKVVPPVAAVMAPMKEKEKKGGFMRKMKKVFGGGK